MSSTWPGYLDRHRQSARVCVYVCACVHACERDRKGAAWTEDRQLICEMVTLVYSLF